MFCLRESAVLQTAGYRVGQLACASSCRRSHLTARRTTLWTRGRLAHRSACSLLCRSQGIFTRQLVAFGAKAATWRAAVAAAAELDVLTALALAADSYTDGPTCVPTLLPASCSSSLHASAGWTATGLRHPCAGVAAGSGGFVPNDTELGGAAPPFLLLTGPNMGGKSTLLRQVSAP
jgi:DNA mismatch repair ATPase MutS